MSDDNRRAKPTDQPAATAVGRSQASQSPYTVEIRQSAVWRGVVYQLAYNVQNGARSKNPYWRAYWHDAGRGKTRSKYIGKTFRELDAGDF